jgi:hypothetical protein
VGRLDRGAVPGERRRVAVALGESDTHCVVLARNCSQARQLRRNLVLLSLLPDPRSPRRLGGVRPERIAATATRPSVAGASP